MRQDVKSNYEIAIELPEKLGATKDARVETNSELQAIFKKEEGKELKRLNRRIEAIKEVYANHLSFKQHLNDINAI